MRLFVILLFISTLLGFHWMAFDEYLQAWKFSAVYHWMGLTANGPGCCCEFRLNMQKRRCQKSVWVGKSKSALLREFGQPTHSFYVKDWHFDLGTDEVWYYLRPEPSDEFCARMEPIAGKPYVVLFKHERCVGALYEFLSLTLH